MIKLNQNETEELIKRNMSMRLHKTNSSKRKKKKTYYVENDDFEILKIIAEMRKCDISKLTSGYIYTDLHGFEMA